MLTRAVVDTGLLSSLGAWTWPGTAADGRQVAHILLAHRIGRTSHDSPEAIEARMRLLSEILGGLAQAQDSVPDTQGTLVTVGSRALLKFPGARWGLRLPAHPQWTRLVQDSGRAVLIVGLDPLTQSADAVRVDAYLDAGITADRLLFGFARTT
ncbi:hypothetical protein J7F03_20375 [Streptomyces sp. ISL-43]|uniref:DUF5949 family protein n=1 Tax=Streptomyces sp. ISL-43 TaxID=2819183 RepID=UPI001BEAF60E|nr:DUF5949 family protein [Streptomyces sp. ISL-43]MBT2449405.1 hypothetical protein [Streptomyces sp. ISL-43]